MRVVGRCGVVALFLLAAVARADDDRDGGGRKAFRSTLVPERGALVGSSVVRGIPSGGLPWILSGGKAELREDGTLHVEVEGLVIDPGVANANAGRNPFPTFRAIVSCVDEAGATINVASDEFPATVPGGDAETEQRLALPGPCYAPIVLVGNAAGRWFAVTGF